MILGSHLNTCIKVEKDGQLVGVAGMGLRMTELSKLIHDFSFGEHGKVFLVRNDGLIQVHPDQQFSGKRQLAEQLDVERMLALTEAVRQRSRSHLAP